MKKKSILLVTLSTLMAASLGLGVLTACNSAEEVKASEYVNGTNFYYGDGQDVHLQGWITSVTNDAWTVEEGFVDEDAEGAPVVTRLGYSKNDAWRNFGVKIDGNYSDFSYLNITMRAETRGLTPGAVNVNMKIVNPIPEKDGVNVLGSDLYFDVSMDTYTTYSFQIPSIYREILDVTNDVCLFPEPGIANSDVIHAGDIYVKDMWFSKERPADGVTPVDDTWRTEAWCGYEVTRGGESEAIISYNRPADWSRFYRPVPYDEIFMENGTVNNMLKLQFTSDDVTIGETVYEDSVEQFQIGLWGNADPSSDGGYYQSWFGQYYRDKYEDTNDWSNNPAVFKVEKDEETGVVTLYCQVAPALIAMAGNFDEQIWICFNLESQPQGGPSDGEPGFIHGPVEFDGIGQMTILSSEFYYDENEPQYREPVVNNSVWGQNKGAYVIKAQEAGTAANITYENVAAGAWTCLVWGIDAAEGNTATIELRNNGTEKVLYGIDWNDEPARKYGFIEPGDTIEVKVQNAAKTGTINFFLDSCYDAKDPNRQPTKDSYSGDIDILGVTFTDEAIDTPDPDEPDDPVVNDSGWNSSVAGAYTVSSEKAGVIANVTYKDLAPDMWCCVAYAINGTAEGNTLTIQLKNNGEEKVLYGIDWNDANARKYGYIEPGATAEIKLQNKAMTGPVNLFLDSCYPGYDSSVTDLHSGDVDIVSMEFTNEVIAPPEEPDEPDPVDVAWGVVDSGKSLYTITGGEEIDANVQYSGVSPDLWANLYRDVSADECKPNVKLTLRNNGTEKVLYGADLGPEETRKYGWIEPEQTVTVELNNENVYTVICLFLDCCYQGDYTTDKVTLSGNVDIVSVEFVEDVAPDPDPDPEPDPEPIALNWTTTAANLSVKDGVVTLNDLMDGAWQNVSADLTLDAGGKITIPVTNNTNAIAKFKLSVMYNNDQGGWSDLEGNGTTVCWLEIPKGETWNMELTVSASDAPKVAHIMLMVACWDKNGTQADGTTPRPEPPYTGTVTIGAMTFAAEAGAVTEKEVDLTYTLAGAEDPSTTIEGNKITYKDLAIGSWNAGIRADYQMESGYTKISFTFKNNSDHAVRMHVAARASDWSTEFGTQRTIIEAGKTATVTLTLTAEQAAQVSILSFYCDCWEEWSEDYAQRPQDGEGNYLTALSGEIVVESVKVS